MTMGNTRICLPLTRLTELGVANAVRRERIRMLNGGRGCLVSRRCRGTVGGARFVASAWMETRLKADG